MVYLLKQKNKLGNKFHSLYIFKKGEVYDRFKPIGCEGVYGKIIN